MTKIITGDRVAVKVTANGDGNWQVISVAKGYQGIVSTLFSDNDYIHGYVEWENGTDWEVYDTFDGGTDGLLQVLNVTGTVVIQRPSSPYASSNGGARVADATGTHTLAIQLGAGSLARMLLHSNPTWKTFTAADPTPSVDGYRLFKTNGSTEITRFDDMEKGKLFLVQRGSADITIASNASIVMPNGASQVLTANNPIAIFIEDGGVARYCGGLSGALREDATALTDGDATPDLSGASVFKTANTSATTITDFDGCENGDVKEIHFEDDNTTIEHGPNVKLPFGVNFAGKQYDMLICRRIGGVWRCK